MFFDDVDQLVDDQADLVRVLSLIVGDDVILFQMLHLVGMRDNSLHCCKGEEGGARERREGQGREEGQGRGRCN